MKVHTLPGTHALLLIQCTHVLTDKYSALAIFHEAKPRPATKSHKIPRLAINSALPHTAIISPTYYFTPPPLLPATVILASCHTHLLSNGSISF